MTYPLELCPVEREIIDRLIKGALSEGLLIAVCGDGEIDLPFSADYDQITANVGICGSTELELLPGQHWFQFVHGNGEDTLTDMTLHSQPLFERFSS